MNAIPDYAALLLGCAIGLIVYGPVKRWLFTLRQTLRDPKQRAGGGRQGTGKLLLIFATMHPAPWLLLIGLPYGAYRLWMDPLRGMWFLFLAGLLLAPALFAIYEWRVAHPRGQSPGARPDGRAS